MSDYSDQKPFDGAEFIDNPEPRCPCILLVDKSGSMAGHAIAQLNEGLITFKDELMADSMAVKRVEVSVISFGPINVESDFQTPDIFQPPLLKASGGTPMGAAIERAVEVLNQRKSIYRQNGIAYYRPWIFLITDGAPTDNWQRATQLVHDGEASRAFVFFAVGTEDADFDTLKRISVRDTLKLRELRFRDLFSWLSNSLSSVSRSTIGDEIPLTNPIAPNGWASIS